MLSNDDFVNWCDLDLDDLLGEFTDDDDFFNPDSDSNNEVSEVKAMKVEVEKVTTAFAASYACPKCERSYRSISGFRGHVLKKHPELHKSNFKAADYKLSEPVSEQSSVCRTTSSAESRAIHSFSLPDDKFLESVVHVNRLAFETITKDQLLTVNGSRGSSMSDYAAVMINRSEDNESSQTYSRT